MSVRKILNSFSISVPYLEQSLEHRIYMAGYAGRSMPRMLRRLIARSGYHRAWLAGFTGQFEEAGVRYGPANPYPGGAVSGPP